MINNNPFEDLPQYPIERIIFANIFNYIAAIIYDIYPYESSDFKAWYYEDEWYILHKPSGTLINWYKHCGRINTCNKKLSIAQYQEFANMFLEDINNNKGINITNEKENVVYYIAERNTPFVHIVEVPISKLTKSQIEEIDYRGIYFSTYDKARQAIIKYYQYDEQ